jgi:hypothetical protein
MRTAFTKTGQTTMGNSESFPLMLAKSISGSTGSSARLPGPWRRPIAIGLGALGLALYNWWIPVALSGSLLTTPDELFSDLEASGRPDAALLQQLDLAAGLVLLVALLARGPLARGLRRNEWPWLLAFALSGAVGGQFSYACPEGLSASCRAAEWRLVLPRHHYFHVAAGIAEFVFGTVAVYLAWQRTRSKESATTRTVRWTARTLVLAYPVLGFAYLTDRFGVFVEPIFFACFSVMVAVELLESDRSVPAGPAAAVTHARQVLHRVLPHG